MQQRRETSGCLSSDPGFGRGISHPFFVNPWLAVVAYLALKPGGSIDSICSLPLATAALVFPEYSSPETFARWRIPGWLNGDRPVLVNWIL
jgi:hypothetical protein